MLAENYNIQKAGGTRKKGAAKTAKIQSPLCEIRKDIDASQPLAELLFRQYIFSR